MTYTVDRRYAINYDEALNGICMVLYVKKDNGQLSIANMQDRETKTDRGDPWYRGCFSNCLISLNAGHTDKLYLMTEEAILRLNGKSSAEIISRLDIEAKHTIERKNA